MRAFWRVEMLGTLQARSDEQVIARFRTRRVGILLAYLAYFPGKGHDRAEVSELLWPEGDPERMSGNLRQALASLRRQIEIPNLLSGGVVRSQNGKLSLDAALVDTDVAEFERALAAAKKAADASGRRAALEKAVSLYRGELLPGYAEEWVLRERSRLEDLYAHALRALAESAQADGHADRAIDALHRALAKDPYDEKLYADLMRLLLDAGQTSSALEHYKEIERRLADELGVEPDEPLRALAREARRRSPEEVPVREAGAEPELSPPATARLPIQLTRLFGRQAETDALVAEFGAARLTFATVLGPAGVGKTTFAVVIARRLATEAGWQAGFVPMADFADASIVLEGVAEALRANREPQGDVIGRIRAAVTEKRTLVVLDNAEHILEDLAPIVATLRNEVPELRLLVTSRQSLKVADEREVALSLLDLPSDEERPDRLSGIASVALFVDRARMVQPDFGLTARNARAVAEICIQLDGLPLAIELAAGLSGAFTPTQMLGHLKHRLDILKTRRRDAPLRHRSLSLALDYSYDTLSEPQKRFFARLSVFSGGFTLAAASAVALDRPDESQALQLLLDLQERSLVFSEASEDETASPRFRLLESFREYGQESLGAKERVENGRRHAEYFLATVSGDVDGMRAAEFRDFRLGVLRDQGNYAAAVSRLVALGRGDDAVRVLSVTTQFGAWGKPRKAEYELLSDLDPKGLSGRSQALAARMMGQYQRAGNMEEANATLERAVVLAREAGDSMVLLRCLVSWSALLTTQQKFESALDLYNEIRAYEGQPGTDRVLSDAYNGLGTCSWMLGQLAEAEAAFRRGLLLSREEPGEESNWLARYNIGRVSIDQGEYDTAVSFAGQAIRIARRLQDSFGVSMGVLLVAMYRWKTGDLEGALASSQEAMELRRNLGLVPWLAQSIQFHAILLADQGDAARAATLLAATERYGSKRKDEELEATMERVRAALPATVFKRAQERGLTMDLDEAYEVAR